MQNFIFQNPTQIRFGSDILKQLGEVVKTYGSNALFVYGKNAIKDIGLYDIVISELKSHNINIIEHSGVKPNPTLEHTNIGVKKVIDNNIDVIVAVGGGSVIDESKAIALGGVGVDFWEVFKGNVSSNKALPIITVLTMPATGSEMNGGFVITNEETKEKFGASLGSVLNPKVSFLDPKYTTTISKQQTAFASADILSHLTEFYFTNKNNDRCVTHFYIEAMAKSLIDATRKIMANPTDIQARASFMWTSSMGWNGLGLLGLKCGSTPCHALEHPMSAYYDIAHGGGLSIATPVWLRFESKNIKDNILSFGKNVLDIDTNDTDVVINALIDFYKEIGAPTCWQDLNVTADCKALALEGKKMFDLWGITELNYSLEDFENLYENMNR